MTLKKLVCTLLLSAVMISVLSSCTAGQGLFQTVYYDLFDTVTVITGYAESSKEYNAGVQKLHEELALCHKLFDIYNEYDGVNNLATVNKNAGVSPVTVDERIIGLVEYSKQMYEQTEGAMNVAMGSVLSLWHRCRQVDNGTLPNETELIESAKYIGFDFVQIDRENSTVYITDKRANLDVGAIAKGYAADLVLALLPETEISAASVNLGGNVCVYGNKPSGDGLWNVGVQSPAENTNLFELDITDMSVVTSGDYQRFFTVDGVNYHHIIDPATLYPSDKFSQVTVICKSSALADALSTALFVTELDKGKELSEEMGVAVIWVEKDGTVHKNAYAEELLKGDADGK